MPNDDIFNNASSTQDTGSDTSNNTNTDHNEIDSAGNSVPDVSALVGEGKKYKTVEAALQSLGHKEAHIARIERENYEMRGELTNRTSLQALLDEIKSEVARKTPNSNSGSDTANTQKGVGNDNQSNESNPGKQADLDINKIVEEKIKQSETRRNADANRAKVVETLSREWGNGYATRLEQEAKSLGLSKEQLNEMAGTNPEIFFRVLGVTQRNNTVSQVVPGRSYANSGTQKPGERRTYKYYEEIRRTNPGKFFSPAIQNEMLNQARALGNDFYK